MIVGSNEAALHLAEGLAQRGLWVPAIRPPTVAPGSARLRVTLCAGHSAEHVQTLIDALHDLEAQAIARGLLHE